MAIYEYQCTCCEKKFELLVNNDEIDNKSCPYCLSEITERLISACSFNLKGDGYYKPGFSGK